MVGSRLCPGVPTAALPVSGSQPGVRQPGGCCQRHGSNCGFIAFGSWWWSSAAQAPSPTSSRTQRGTPWRRSGSPTSAERFYGYVCGGRWVSGVGASHSVLRVHEKPSALWASWLPCCHGLELLRCQWAWVICVLVWCIINKPYLMSFSSLSSLIFNPLFPSTKVPKICLH